MLAADRLCAAYASSSTRPDVQARHLCPYCREPLGPFTATNSERELDINEFEEIFEEEGLDQHDLATYEPLRNITHHVDGGGLDFLTDEHNARDEENITYQFLYRATVGESSVLALLAAQELDNGRDLGWLV